MADGKVSVLGILALLIGSSALGLGGYTLFRVLMISDQLNALEDNSVLRASRTSSYGVANHTWEVVDFNVLDFNVGNNFDLTSDRFTCAYTGYYLISGKATFASLDFERADFYVTIYRNGGYETGTTTRSFQVDYISISVVDTLYLNEGDIIDLRVYHTSNGTVDVYGTSTGGNTYLSITFMNNLNF